MKAQIRLKNVVVEVEGSTQKDLFTALAGASEVFGEEACGLCKGDKIRPVVRNVTSKKKDYTYYEFHCLNPKCRARLSIGVNLGDAGTLFPQRKLNKDGKPDRDEGTYGDHNGWTKYKGEPKEEAK